MNTPVWTPSSSKLAFYEALYYLNRRFEATLMALDRLRDLQLVRAEYLNAWRTKLESLRAEANEELTDELQEYEQKESARFDQLDREWERQRQDPDDVLLAARDRKQEINQQIKHLQRALKSTSGRAKRRR